MHRLKMKTKLMLGLVFLVVIFAGCNINLPVKNEKSCNSVDDCACGVYVTTSDCFFGNKAFVNTEKQCPDFCTGIAGNLELRCVNNECKQVNTYDEKYCDVDSDCVRQNSCCDCGLGKYVNKKYQVIFDCYVVCKCATQESTGKCINNQCTAVPKEVLQEGFCGTSTLASCQTSDDCVKGGCSGQVCQSKNEEPVITTCDIRDCYNGAAYNLKCQCFENKCQWR